jgi:hypothetical protein
VVPLEHGLLEAVGVAVEPEVVVGAHRDQVHRRLARPQAVEVRQEVVAGALDERV